MYDPYIDVVLFITKEIIIMFIGIGTLLKNYICQWRIQMLFMINI